MISGAPLASAQAIGLPESAMAAIRRVLATYPEVESAILYGSRALGRHRPASDIDLTLTGHAISNATLARIDADLDDLLLPWLIDLSALAAIRHPALLDHIQRAGVLLYQRSDPPAFPA
ncbi:nucleotidyltransferase domain-containing protein [Cyanobium sp. AMD-g]|uniref:nucleotidyltransferase domain-containing protein n=1 Tax=Cyanobium sp. AMD-g TaxID=2823699 RepID=UPI0020CF430A|nr:nucleotidyltransferase domain-containing protein [Cyanobium sp. AMD-g]MCP9931114.1 nucleotidyltransferase domain-containing protein [Cyanobium sp. AMD-g]